MTTRPSEPTIFTGWWDFAVRAFSLLTNPRVDVAACDREVESLARDSLAGRAVHGATLRIRRAWSASRTRALLEAGIAALVPSNAIERWRIGGAMAAVAGATVLLLTPFATASSGPLIWVTPALLVVVGLFVMVCAAALARAAADRRRRVSSSSTQ